MNKKQQRILYISIVVVIAIVAVSTLLSLLNKSIAFFVSPSELQSYKTSKTHEIRLGGLVKTNSITHNDTNVDFIITDCNTEITVHYTGSLPALFRDGQGVIATGYLDDNVFQAKELLVKHDEKYVPKEMYNKNHQVKTNMCK